MPSAKDFFCVAEVDFYPFRLYGEFFWFIAMKQNIEQITRYSLEESATRLGFSELTLRRIVKRGEISYYRPTPFGKIMFTEEHLAEFEKRRTFLAKAA